MLRAIAILLMLSCSRCYIIYTVDDPNVCNQSIYLERGPNSAAILKMTARDSYYTTPMHCTIRFKVPIHNWSGLTGILEDVDMRAWDDTSHHLGQATCVDHITVDTEKHTSLSNDRQCGTWSVTPGEPLTKLGYNRALVGYCPHSVSWDNTEKCHVTELKVIVSVGLEKQQYLWSNHTWRPHRGFTFVVTAYSYPIKNGESECRDGLRSCSQTNTPGSRLGVYHCVHDSLWCDGHVNCGLLENMDEIACFRKGIWGGLVTVVIGPWMGASILLLLAFCGILYWRSSRLRIQREPPITNQEINSYAESYELSSNLSSAHQMAIQVRVVCNSNHQHHGNRGLLQPWVNDLPPSYDALFPQGPPQPYNAENCASTQNITASITATVAGGCLNSVSTLGVNVTATATRPTSVLTVTDANTSTETCTGSATNTSSQVETSIPLPSQMSDTTNSTSSAHCSSSDHNIPVWRVKLPQSSSAQLNSNISNLDTSVAEGSNVQASVTLTVTPNQRSNNEDPGIVSQSQQSNIAEHLKAHSRDSLSSTDDISKQEKLGGELNADITNSSQICKKFEYDTIAEDSDDANDNDSCTESDDNQTKPILTPQVEGEEESAGINCENAESALDSANYLTTIDCMESAIQTMTPSTLNEVQYPLGITVVSNSCGEESNTIEAKEENNL